jgi:hypothetical protein
VVQINTGDLLTERDLINPEAVPSETVHFLLRLHPDNTIANPTNTPEGHEAAGGGILKYGTILFTFRGK